MGRLEKRTSSPLTPFDLDQIVVRKTVLPFSAASLKQSSKNKSRRKGIYETQRSFRNEPSRDHPVRSCDGCCLRGYRRPALRERRGPRPADRAPAGSFPPERQGALDPHPGSAQAGEGRTTLRRHKGLRRTGQGPDRTHDGAQDPGRRRARRLGHGTVSFPRPAGGIRQHPSLAAPQIAAQQQLRALRGDPRHLPGARVSTCRTSPSFAARPAGSSSTLWSAPNRFERRGSYSRSTSARACRSRR